MPVGHGLIISLLLIACMPVANAAPNIPLGEMPGREGERFNPSPVDRFTDPFAWPGQAEPLYRWCNGKPRRAKRKQGGGSRAADVKRVRVALPFSDDGTGA